MINLANTKKMVLEAHKNGYAVPAFNIHNLENMRACVQAAVKLRSPLILAATPSTFTYSGLANLVAITGALNETNDIPIALHMDHHKAYESIEAGIKSGIRSVMVDASLKTLEENTALTKQVVQLARQFDVTVEAELGKIPGVEDDVSISHEEAAEFTDPHVACQFVSQTKVDMLAIAIGNAHGIYHAAPKLNIRLLKKVTDLCNVPLVLHGGSGISVSQVQECIKNGVAKVNVGTELKAPYANGLIDFFKKNPEEHDPRYFFANAIKAVQELAENKIKMCRADGRY